MKDQGEGVLRLPARKSLDLVRQIATVREGKILRYDFCSEDWQALALQQREYAESVERGEIRGKEPCDPWTQRARDERGKPVERRVHLATESTPEKPILLGGGKDEYRVIDMKLKELGISDYRRGKVQKALKKGKSINDAIEELEISDRAKYYGSISQSSANKARESDGEASDMESDGEAPDRESDVEELDRNLGRVSLHRDSHVGVSERGSDGEASDRESDRRVPYRESDTAARYEPLYDRSGSLIKMNGRHNYFDTQYKISPPNDNRSPYTSDLKNGCVVNMAMMLLRDQNITLPLQEVASALDYYNNRHGGSSSKIPSLFKNLKKQNYQVPLYKEIQENLSIEELRENLKLGYAIGIGARNTDNEQHELVIDAIDDKYIYIRDSLPPNPDEGRYCVTIEDFKEITIFDAIVPSKGKLWFRWFR